ASQTPADKLADLGMKLAHFCFAPLVAITRLTIEYPGHSLDRLALPAGDQVRVNCVLAGKLRHRQLASDRLHSDLRLELTRESSARRHRGSSSSGFDPA